MLFYLSSIADTMLFSTEERAVSRAASSFTEKDREWGSARLAVEGMFSTTAPAQILTVYLSYS